MIADYELGGLAELPLLCPFVESADGCDVQRHDLRVRKTGPAAPLVVCRCHVHGVSFTVYPPGFVPYARRRLSRTEPTDSDPALLDVADAAASRQAWPRDGGVSGSWSTQGRLLELGMAITGQGSEITVRNTWSVAYGLPLTTLLMGERAEGYRARGSAILAAMALIPQEHQLEALLVGGCLAERWGVPWRWHRTPQRLRCLVAAPHRPIRSMTSGPRAPPTPE